MEITKSEIIQTIKNAGIDGNVDAFDHDATLAGNVFDSLDMLNILLALEENYAIKIPDEDIHKLHSINAIAEYLSN